MEKLKKSLLWITLLLIAFSLTACGGGTPKTTPEGVSKGEAIQQETIKLTVLSSWGIELGEVNHFLIPFTEELKKRSEGRIEVKWVGPESVPPLEQFQPVKDGVFDLLFTNGAYHSGEIIVGSMIEMGVVDSMQQSKDLGLYGIVDEAYQKEQNMKLVSAFPVGGYHIVLRNKKIDKADFSGLKIRATAFYQSLIKGLGGSTVTVPGGEIYSVMEKGVVDGYSWPASDTIRFRWNEVAKYLIRPKFGQPNYLLLGNGDKWNSLPADVQDLITEVADEIGVKAREQILKEQEEEERKLVEELGMEIINLSPEEAKKYNEVFQKETWDNYFADRNKEYGQRIKAITDTLPSVHLQ